jgi:hypothetical protein
MTQEVGGSSPYGAPLMHICRLGPDGVFANFAEHFEAIWATSHPPRTNDTN